MIDTGLFIIFNYRFISSMRQGAYNKMLYANHLFITIYRTNIRALLEFTPAEAKAEMTENDREIM